jgi:hypothetical protein
MRHVLAREAKNRPQVSRQFIKAVFGNSLVRKQMAISEKFEYLRFELASFEH